MENDPINPNHYKGLFQLKDNECIRLARTLDFDLGNYVKYIYRCGNKIDALEDFEKACWYMEDWLANHHPVFPHGGYYDNPCSEKAMVAFDFIAVPEEGTELHARYKLLEQAVQPFITPKAWRKKLRKFKVKYLLHADDEAAADEEVEEEVEQEDCSDE